MRVYFRLVIAIRRVCQLGLLTVVATTFLTRDHSASEILHIWYQADLNIFEAEHIRVEKLPPYLPS